MGSGDKKLITNTQCPMPHAPCPMPNPFMKQLRSQPQAIQQSFAAV
ncbi:MAG: hypothetical protein V7L04_18515 [Nostoc sp.]